MPLDECTVSEIYQSGHGARGISRDVMRVENPRRRLCCRPLGSLGPRERGVLELWQIDNFFCSSLGLTALRKKNHDQAS